MLDTVMHTERYVLLLAIIVAIFGSLYKLLGHAVAHLVEELPYNSEGRGFDSRWCHWNFSLT